MKRRVLVLCTGNSCRSQMAEALWEQLGEGKWDSESAGSHPSGYVHHLAIEVMKEIGLDISTHRSQSVNEFQNESFDLVITVCDNAKESCPVFPGGTETLHWPFDDPADATGTDEEKLSVFRRVRDEIRSTIQNYLSNKG
ncbi:Arsenate reductase ArsC [Planctomycetales bacterium 10988]|nr:Arsenate reductase ArsC [Planctomycetales bacterium 10988]